MVMIGIDPHKGTHTAVAIDSSERVLDERLVRATARQVPELLEWATRLDGGDRIWAIESAGGLGYLLAQQLLAAGEQVVDIPATLASRVRLLGTGRSAKLRCGPRNWSQCGSRTTRRCCGCWPVGTPSWAGPTTRPPAGSTPSSPNWCRAGSPQKSLFPRPDRCSRTTSPSAQWPSNGTWLPSTWSTSSTGSPANAQRCAKRIGAAVKASGTTLVEIFGVGDVVAAIILGQVGDITRFPTPARFAAYNGTAPIEWSSGNPNKPVHRLSRRGNRALNHAIHIAAVTQIRHRHSPGRAYYDRKRAEGHTGGEAIRSLKRQLSDVIYRHLVADAAQRG